MGLNPKTWRNIAIIIVSVLVIGAIGLFLYKNWYKIIDGGLDFVYGNVAPDLTERFHISDLID